VTSLRSRAWFLIISRSATTKVSTFLSGERWLPVFKRLLTSLTRFPVSPLDLSTDRRRRDRTVASWFRSSGSSSISPLESSFNFFGSSESGIVTGSESNKFNANADYITSLVFSNEWVKPKYMSFQKFVDFGQDCYLLPCLCVPLKTEPFMCSANSTSTRLIKGKFRPYRSGPGPVCSTRKCAENTQRFNWRRRRSTHISKN